MLKRCDVRSRSKRGGVRRRCALIEALNPECDADLVPPDPPDPARRSGLPPSPAQVPLYARDDMATAAAPPATAPRSSLRTSSRYFATSSANNLLKSASTVRSCASARSRYASCAGVGASQDDCSDCSG